MRREVERTAKLSLAGLLMITMTGCGAARSQTTCQEYGVLSAAEQHDLLDSLLQEHDLETPNVSNAVGVQSAVDEFCGTTTGFGFPAKTNLQAPLEQAADWGSGKW